MSDWTLSPKYLCGQCGKWITTKRDGTLRAHTGNTRPYIGSPHMGRCEGSGMEP